jgi:hypothetical protein
MRAPRTPEEWWANLDARWEDIKRCAWMADTSISLPPGPNAPGAARWSHHVLPTYRDLPDVSSVKGLHMALEHFMDQTREFMFIDGMLRILNDIWLRAPDDSRIHSWPSWHVICDLCSESWVFFEYPPEQEPLAVKIQREYWESQRGGERMGEGEEGPF